jgi:hypothetical protein
MSVPPLTPQQRAAAAARGVAARRYRAGLRRGLRDGSVALADVLTRSRGDDEQAQMVSRMRVADLVTSFRGVGPVRATALMEGLGIPPDRRVRGLGARQAEGLVAALAPRVPAPPHGATAPPVSATAPPAAQVSAPGQP